jgi:hypothetical protein
MSFLKMLLGSQAAPNVVGRPASMEEQPNEGIRVTPPYNPEDDMPRQAAPPEDYTIDNTNDILIRDEALRRAEKAADRRGMFGVKGTLRDVIGTLGDAFLVQSGNDAVYAPTREKERFSDAMAGSSRDPTAAYERAMGVNPDAAMDFYGKYQTAENQAQGNQIRQGELNRGVADDRVETLGKARDQIARWLGATTNDTQRAYVLGELAPQYLQGMNLTMEDLQLQPGMTGEEAGIYARGDMRVNQQLNIPIAQQRANAATRNAESSAIRAAREPQPRAPRAESDSERAVRIGNTPAAQRSQGERDWYERYNRQGKSGSILETFRQNQESGAAPASRFRPAGRPQ